MPHNRKNRDFRPEARARTEERSEARIKRAKIQGVEVITSVLERQGSCGVMAIRSANRAPVIEGLKLTLGGRLCLLPAEGNIQGAAQDEEFAETTLGAISIHRRLFGGRGVLGFMGVDFSGQSGDGSAIVHSRVAELVALAKPRRPGILSRKNPSELAIIAIGTGEYADLPSSTEYDRGVERGVVDSLGVRFALERSGDLTTVPDVEQAGLLPISVGNQNIAGIRQLG